MKKILSVLIVITLIASLFALPVFAEGTTEGYVKFSLSDGTAKTKNSFILNRQFDSNDSKAELTADGYSLSNVDTYSDTLGLARHETSGKMSVIYKGATFGGNYTFEVVGGKAHGWGFVYVNY